MPGAFCQCLCICRNFALSQTQRQFQCRLCRAGTHQRTVGAGDEELFYIDGLTAGRTQIHRAHRADGIAAVGACQTGDADSDIGPAASAAPSAICAATGADTTLYFAIAAGSTPIIFALACSQ